MSKRNVRSDIMKIRVPLIIILTFSLLFTVVSATSTMKLYLSPLHSNGTIQSDVMLSYVFNFTNQSDCSQVELSVPRIVTIDTYGRGFTEFDVSSIMSDQPSYLCEYREGSLRKVHPLSTVFFNVTVIGNFIPPRMTDTQRDAITSPSAGSILYDTTNNKTDFYDGTIWKSFVSTDVSTFTVGSIPFATDTHHISDDNNNLFWNNANKRLGIGTNNPSYPLHIEKSTGGSLFTYLYHAGNSSSSHAVSLIQTEGAGGGDPLVRFSVGETPVPLADWTIGIDNSDSDKFKISSSTKPQTNTRMTIDTSGNVGIGTNSPIDLLDVEGYIRADRFYMDRDSGSQSSYIQKGAYGSFKGMSFYTVDNHRMIISEGGNVGIGTTTPTQKLDVNGSVNITNNLFVANLPTGTPAPADMYVCWDATDGSLFLNETGC